MINVDNAHRAPEPVRNRDIGARYVDVSGQSPAICDGAGEPQVAVEGGDHQIAIGIARLIESDGDIGIEARIKAHKA